MVSQVSEEHARVPWLASGSGQRRVGLVGAADANNKASLRSSCRGPEYLGEILWLRRRSPELLIRDGQP
jgi:hypothetical protein